MRQPSRTRRRLGRQPPAIEDTRRQLAVLIAALFVLCCAAALLALDNPLLDRLLPFLAQQLALVLGYYYGRREGSWVGEAVNTCGVDDTACGSCRVGAMM
jgi:hypothetical protein